MKLRQSQIKAIYDIRKALTSNNKVAFCAMTGSGKTVIALEIIKEALSKEKKVLFVMRGKKLTEQNYRIFKKYFNTGKILQSKKQLKPISVASIDSILSTDWFKKSASAYFDFVVVDEAHLSTATNYMDFLKSFNSDCKFLGLSATYGLNNNRCHNFWDCFIIGNDGFDLLKEGSVPELKQFHPDIHYDLKGVGTTGNDYNTSQLFNRVDQDKTLYGDIIKWYKKKGDHRPAIAFCINIRHAEKVTELFVKENYNVITFHSKMSTKEKKKSEKALKFFRINKRPFVIVNVDMLTAGIDIPELEVALILRPTKSENKFRQQCGRLTRTKKGSDKKITIIDFTTNSQSYGHVYFMMTPKRVKYDKIKNEDLAETFFLCSYCSYLSVSKFIKCPECGKEKLASEKKKGYDEKKETELKELTPKPMNRKEIKEILDFYSSI